MDKAEEKDRLPREERVPEPEEKDEGRREAAPAAAAAESAGTEALRPAAKEKPEESASALRRELEESRARITELERESLLLRRGVPEEDLDYYVYKIGKLVSDDRDFNAAAAEFLKQHARRRSMPVSTGAELSGTAGRTPTANQTMNKLLRGL